MWMVLEALMIVVLPFLGIVVSDGNLVARSTAAMVLFGITGALMRDYWTRWDWKRRL